MAFYVKNASKNPTVGQVQNKFQKKKRPTRTYCGYTGHGVDKCYKFHGYPPGYKAKQNSGFGSNFQVNHAAINQVSDSFPEPAVGNVGEFMQTLNHTQYQQLMNTSSTHLTSTKTDAEIGNKSGHISGFGQHEGDWQG